LLQGRPVRAGHDYGADDRPLRQFTDEINKWPGQNMTVEQTKEMMRRFYPDLKRRKNKL
jgi:hypothetical protein